MSNKTVPVLAAIVLGAVALSPVFIKSFGDNPQMAAIGSHQIGSGAAAVNAQSSEITKVGYSLGYMMGENVKQGAKELNPADISQGITDGFNGKPATMSREDMIKVVQTYEQNQMQARLQENLAKGDAFLAQNGKKAGIKTTASGLQYQILREGNGKTPKATDQVECHYEGTLINGTKFDSSYDRGQTATFPLNGVIAGWTEGLQLMKEGAKYRFFIPYTLGYGERGAGASIPPYAALVFDVELVAVK